MIRRFFLIHIFALLVSAGIHAQPYCDIRTFNIRDGLASNFISSIAEDKKGMVWLSTWNGLCYYDGYRFTTFRDFGGAARVLSTNRLLHLTADDYGCLWGTTYDAQIYLFDTKACRFVDVSAILRKKTGTDFRCERFFRGADGYIWAVAKHGDGPVVRMNSSVVERGENIEVYSRKSGPLKGRKLIRVRVDGKGREWLFTDRGVVMRDGKCFASDKPFYNFAIIDNKVYLLSRSGEIAVYDERHNRINTLVPGGGYRFGSTRVYGSRHIVIGTDRGVFFYDTRTRRSRIVSVQSPSQPDAEVKDLFIDSRNRVWAFTSAPGVTMIDPSSDRPVWLNTTTQDRLTQTTTDRPFMHEDGNKTVWLIPTGGTFAYYDEAAKQLCPYVLRSPGAQHANLPLIKKSFIDSQGNLWFSSTHDITLINFKYHHFRYTPADRNEEVRAVMTDSSGRRWVGTGSGYVMLYSQQGNFIGYLDTQGKISETPVNIGYKVMSFLEDSRNRIWIGTRGAGLYMLDKGKMSRFAPGTQPYTLNCGHIFDLCQDRRGRIWVATYGGGINLIDEQGGNIRFLNARRGLESFPLSKFEDTRRITHNRQGVMIVSTTTGMLTFSDDFKTPSAIRYYANHSDKRDTTTLATNDVLQVYVTTAGRIFTTTLGGEVQEILSENLLDNHLKFGRVKRNSHDSQEGMAQSLVEDNSGRLWIVHDGDIDVYDPKKETMAKFGPNDLGENMEITEAEPFIDRKTGVITLGALGGTITFNPADLKFSSFKPEIVFNRVQYQGEAESHPILNMRELVVPSDKRSFTIDFAALDYSNNYMVRYAYMVEGVDDEWNYLGNRSHTASYNNFPAGHYRLLVKSTNADGVWTDNIATLDIYSQPTFWETVWARILYMILFVAVAYAVIRHFILRQKIKMGREMDRLKTNFFTQIGHKLRTPLTLIGGPVTEVLRSENINDNERSMLKMVQRNSKQMLDLVNKMLDHNQERNYIVDDATAPVFGTDAYDTGTTQEKAPEGSIKLLVVEDNHDLRKFLVAILSSQYTVITAENGRKGLEKAAKEMPDFILTDVMMPEMDGLTMVHHIKQNKDICHIPIVVLSAKASLDDRLQGLNEGVDDYITKPFSATYLKHRIENIIRQRQMIQETVLGNISVKPENAADEYRLEPTEIVDTDKEMMNKLMAYLNDHLSDSELKIEDLADAVCLGRSIFYSKLKSVIGMTPVEFLKHIRMQKAEELVGRSNMTFSQIAYEVGFTDPKYFTKCFKKETGLTPSEYRKNMEKE